LEHKFNPETCRHSSNGVTTVLHCHHYASLYCQLADDAELFDGKALLRKAAEMSFLPVMKDYFSRNGVTELADRISAVEDYWKKCGMGLLEFERVGGMSAIARMDHSHVDRGWIRKWGNRDEAVNFIGQGFLSAAMAAIFEQPEGSYVARETESIVAGSPESRFTIVRQ
jgi:hypothetical protein